MNDIKYEPAFGNQTFFDGAPEDAVLAVSFCDGIVYFSDSFKYPSVDFTSGTSIAMRRIIRTPTWTKADQLAGRLPEIGCDVQTINGEAHEFVGKSAHEGQWSLRDKARNIIFHCPAGWVKPIETEAERRQREENEVVTSLLNDLMPDSSLQWRCIFERGVRAAYRKLKIPEVKK